MSRPRHALAALAVACGGAGGSAAADHILQYADPRLIEAIGTYARAYEAPCEAGSGPHCVILSQVGVEAHLLLTAGYSCRFVHIPESCAVYQTGIGRLADQLVTLPPDALPTDAPPGWVPKEAVDRHMLRPDRWTESRDLLVQLLTAPPQLSSAEQHERFLEQLRE